MPDPPSPAAHLKALGEQVSAPEAGPKPTRSLHQRRATLMDPVVQIAHLDEVALRTPASSFSHQLEIHDQAPLTRAPLDILQLNLGRLCNMACRHCHVDAGPDRHDEVMTWETMQQALGLLDRSTATTVDLTGGAPELNPWFMDLIEALSARGKHVIDRCNLTVLLLPQFCKLPAWLAEHGVEVVCSLPHYRARNTDALRGPNSFGLSVRALQRLNAVGYGTGDPRRQLTIMTNPAGAYLAGDQASLTVEFRRALQREHGVTFDRLIALNNMPIGRYLEWLEESDNLTRYLQRLVDEFNPAAVAGLMCKNTLSVSWQGGCYDCDFNQVLDLPLRDADGRPHTLVGLDPATLSGREVCVARHCFGCTAGAGSSCGGATA